MGEIPEDTSELELLGEAYDAALWVSEEPRAGFERIAPDQFDGLPGYQEFTELVAFEGRLFAVADPIWQSTDGGQAWSPMDDVGAPVWSPLPKPQAIVGENELLIGDNVLVRGSSSWERRRLPDSFPANANELLLPDGTSALTWNEDQACDCSVAFAGRLVEDEVARNRLEFHDCEDTSGRGLTGAYEPGIVGDGIAALASCDDLGQPVASLAYSQDGGQTWTTMRLTKYAPAGLDLQLAGYPRSFVFVHDDTALIALLRVTTDTSPFDEETGQPSPPFAQIIALRISAGD